MEVTPLLSAYHDEILLDSRLFVRIKYLFDRKEKLSLTSEQKFLLENLFKNFKTNGALLKGADKDTLKKLNEKISLLVCEIQSECPGRN